MDTKTINLIDAALDDLAAAGLNPIIPKVAGAFAESLARRIYANQTRPAKRDLAELIEDAHAFKAKHEARAVRIRPQRVHHPEAHVSGTFFNVDGDVASPAVFYLTDSTTRFLYGALYFDARPNADSLEPVTQRLRADLQRFAATLTWR